MNGDEFVRLVELCVRDSAIKATLSNLQDPPGQAPLQELVEASKWFLQQDERSKQIVEYIIRRSANFATVFFLSVIDGAMAIEDPGPNRGDLELYHVTKSSRVRLNDMPLNEVFQA
jgi:hypothetical protein